MRLVLHDWGCETILVDGSRVPAMPHDTDEYRARARALGYGDDTMRACIEHELVHVLLARLLGLPESPALARVARGEEGETEITWREEAAVLAVQALANACGVRLIERVRGE